jgi:5'-phosphate synthase pdxT subunit
MLYTIGVLALQGAFAKHAEQLNVLDVEAIEVRRPAQLDRCDGLIIPGGESTTLTKLMRLYDFHEPIRIFAKSHPIMGTCAGLIMVASRIDDERVEPLGLIDMSVARNAYGRQIDSFITDVEAHFLENEKPFRTIFIRAPQIREVGPKVEILLEYDGVPIMVRQGHIFALAFHPELTDDPRIHQYFLKACIRSKDTQ